MFTRADVRQLLQAAQPLVSAASWLMGGQHLLGALLEVHHPGTPALLLPSGQVYQPWVMSLLGVAPRCRHAYQAYQAGGNAEGAMAAVGMKQASHTKEQQQQTAAICMNTESHREASAWHRGS
jgi:hypothetical protein